jgi:hypothetical protein
VFVYFCDNTYCIVKVKVNVKGRAKARERVKVKAKARARFIFTILDKENITNLIFHHFTTG